MLHRDRLYYSNNITDKYHATFKKYLYMLQTGSTLKGNNK